MRSVFEWLYSLLDSGMTLALTASFIWGVFSIVLSPCHLASIPLIVGFIDGQEKMTVKRAFIMALLFSVGILITITVVGLITGLLGRMIGDIGPYGNYFVAVVLILMGLLLLDVIKLPLISPEYHNRFQKKGKLAAFLLGLIFGIAMGPCTFAFMAPMLGIVFSIASENFSYAFLLILFYAIGHCLIIVLAGTFTGLVQRFLHWNERSKGAVILKKVCGILVIIGGIYMFFYK